MARHIVLQELGADFTIEVVDTQSGKTASRRAYRDINQMGYVPALELETGDILTEGPSIL